MSLVRAITHLLCCVLHPGSEQATYLADLSCARSFRRRCAWVGCARWKFPRLLRTIR